MFGMTKSLRRHYGRFGGKNNWRDGSSNVS